MTKKLWLLISGLCFINFISCTTPTKSEFEDVVVARADGLSSRPNWVKDTKTVIDQGDHFDIIGVAEVPGQSRPQASFMASDAAARGHLVSKIETQVTKLVESSNTGYSMESQSLKSLIKEFSQSTLKDVDIKDRYWEKVKTTEASGSSQLVLKAYSLIAVNKEELKKMMKEKSNSNEQLKSALQKTWEFSE